MRIGKLVAQTGFSRDTIRYYERLGLLQAGGRPSAFNTYKDYPDALVARLGLIKQAKDLGFTLAEIADVLALWENAQPSNADIQARITEKVTELDEKIRQLEAMRASLLRNLTATQTGNCN